MRVLQALFFPPEQPGGVSSMIPYVQKRFEELGWEMELFSLPKRVRNKGTMDLPFHVLDIGPYQHDPIVAKYLQTFRDYMWWSAMRLEGRAFDLIHAHHPIVAITMKWLYPNTPVMATIHSSYERELLLNNKIDRDSLAHRFLTAIYRELELQVDRLVTVSESFRTYLRPYMNNVDRIEVLPNGFDENRFKPMPHHNPVTQLLTVCRLVPAKGIDVLLRACSALKDSGHSFVLHVIGDGPIRVELEQMARDLNIYEEIIFYGYMLHPENFMPFSDVFVLPSRAEAFGSVFAEAALCKLALVGTDVGGIAEQIRHGENGLLVPVDNVEALTDVLSMLINDRNQRVTLSERAWQVAIDQYSLERVMERLTTIYQQYL